MGAYSLLPDPDPDFAALILLGVPDDKDAENGRDNFRGAIQYSWEHSSWSQVRPEWWLSIDVSSSARAVTPTGLGDETAQDISTQITPVSLHGRSPERP